ncbi:hypothetical protein [Acetivibrio ethanolgignens]|uniref:Uncharacterized protein n=1 Tax=Acetivibrio ethanolgignens TaxID=290052 RepID=A0A0V8QBY1_9FIRM|nr:hypothetical protein [Acetivibrio ethanolgignens]KSV58066.1 hypothetical protein ASU35_03255 [Acetivibrio ethanolgignens]
MLLQELWQERGSYVLKRWAPVRWERLAEFSGEAKVLEVENLTSMAEYERLAEQLEEKNGIYTKITADS